MTWGLKVLGSAGFTQIDSGFMGYALHSRGTFPAPAIDQPMPSFNYSNITSSYPLILVRPSAAATLPVNVTNVNFQHSHPNRTFYGHQLDWALFIPANEVTESSGSWGLRVWDGQGRLAFSSLRTPMLIRSLTQHTFPATNSPPIYLPYTGERPYVLGNNIVTQWAAGAPSYQAYGMQHRWEAARVAIQPAPFQNTIVDFTDNTQPRTYILGGFVA